MSAIKQTFLIKKSNPTLSNNTHPTTVTTAKKKTLTRPKLGIKKIAYTAAVGSVLATFILASFSPTHGNNLIDKLTQYFSASGQLATMSSAPLNLSNSPAMGQRLVFSEPTQPQTTEPIFHIDTTSEATQFQDAEPDIVQSTTTPEVTQFQDTEPDTVQSTTAPEIIQPQATEPTTVQSTTTPEIIQPQTTEPVTSQSTTTPETTHPQATEPVTSQSTTAPEITQPQPSSSGTNSTNQTIIVDYQQDQSTHGISREDLQTIRTALNNLEPTISISATGNVNDFSTAINQMEAGRALILDRKITIVGGDTYRVNMVYPMDTLISTAYTNPSLLNSSDPQTASRMENALSVSNQIRNFTENLIRERNCTSEREKIAVIFDYIANHVTYDTAKANLIESRTISGQDFYMDDAYFLQGVSNLINGAQATGVCISISKLVNVFMDSLRH